MEIHFGSIGKYRTLYLRFIYQEMKSCAKMKLVFIFGQCIMTIMCLYSVFCAFGMTLASVDIKCIRK